MMNQDQTENESLNDIQRATIATLNATTGVILDSMERLIKRIEVLEDIISTNSIQEQMNA